MIVAMFVEKSPGLVPALISGVKPDRVYYNFKAAFYGYFNLDTEYEDFVVSC